MFVTIAHFAVVVALSLAAIGVLASLVALRTGLPAWVRVGRQAVYLTFAMLTLGMAGLEYAFLSHDYSLAYVAANSNSDLPLFYLATALWGGHEGSLLLWAWLLSLYAALAARLHWNSHALTMPYLLLVTSALLVGFISMIVFLSSPFELLQEIPVDGQGLNPLLQDPGMVFHPPFLYMGYVGFSIPFAFAMAALFSGRVSEEWLKATRRWTLFAWLMLTFGIVMGGYWAYYELGWGGYWAWDPVENASFMPWLTATAFLHSMMVQEARRSFKVWNVFLIIVTFALSLLGTFLVRSGVISSVHSFASDPSRGVYILLFMGIVLAFSFGALIVRSGKLKSEVSIDSLASREATFLFNNLFFLVAAATVFVGTLYPLFLEALTGGKVTVGAPYYNQVLPPLMLGIVLLMGIGPLIPWRKASVARLKQDLLLPLGCGLLATAAGFMLGMREAYPLIGLGVACFAAVAIALNFRSATLGVMRRDGLSWPRALWAATTRNKRRFGGQIVHAGVVMMMAGLIGSGAFKTEKDVLLNAGDSFALGSYTVRFQGAQFRNGHNYDALVGFFEVWRGTEKIAELRPERRNYVNAAMPTTEAAIDDTWLRDIYLTLGSANGDAYAVKAYLNPLVKWIWTGVIVMGLGTLLALLQGRRIKEGKA